MIHWIGLRENLQPSPRFDGRPWFPLDFPLDCSIQWLLLENPPKIRVAAWWVPKNFGPRSSRYLDH